MKPGFTKVELNREIYITLNKDSLTEQKLGQGISGKITECKNDFLSKDSSLYQFYLSNNLHNQKKDLWVLQDPYGNYWELPYEDISAVTYLHPM